jgi:predicted phage-related endonuclease
MAKKKGKQLNPGQVIIPVGHPNPPESHEVDVAMVLARHYQTTVEFLLPVDDYKRKSADVTMLGVEWEIKSPIGKSKYTIQEQFRRASKQAKNIIIDTRRTKLKYKDIEKSLFFELRKRPYISKVVLMDKSEKVIEFQL